MFESDDFDQVLSQLDYIEASPNVHVPPKILLQSHNEEKQHCTSKIHNVPEKKNSAILKPLSTNNILLSNISPIDEYSESHFDGYDKIEIHNDDRVDKSSNIKSHKDTKKRLIGSLFDHQTKRKFPGPAGILLHSRSHCDDEDLSRLEISSQDVNFSQEPMHESAFDLTLWKTLENDVVSWGINRLDSISNIKQYEMAGRLNSRKAHALIAFVEAIDRSVDNPLIILRDSSGTIKCTLHRDAWSEFAACIMSEYAAIALWKPTVLTTGTTYKKHYLNITLSNIIAIYCSNNVILEDKPIPEGYIKNDCKDFIALRKDNMNCLKSDPGRNKNVANNESSEHLDGLDTLSFLEEEF